MSVDFVEQGTETVCLLGKFYIEGLKRREDGGRY
jgi:hypothetical protein